MERYKVKIVDEENRLKAQEAIEFAIQNGVKFTIKGLAMEMYGDTNPDSAEQNLYHLRSGYVKTIGKKPMHVFCRITGVSPDFLFGWS